MTSRRRRLALVVTLALALGACSVERVNESEVGIHYSDGPIEGQRVEDIVEPGGSATVFDDTVYRLPARQVTWIASGGENADAPPLGVTAEGGEHLQVGVSIRFFLNTREDALKRFFVELCDKHDCWNDEGWVAMLQETFGTPLRAVASDLGLSYEAEELRYNTDIRDQFASQLADRFVSEAGRLIGRDDYFCGPGYRRGADPDSREHGCPTLSVEVLGVTFENAERENIREAQELAAEQEALAAQQAATARAQQETVRAQATPEWVRQQQAQAMRECAANPECQLTVVVSGNDVGVSVPAR
jgi:regulator of protease activity HflC (stomatin/prohibitin superfamily)